MKTNRNEKKSARDKKAAEILRTVDTKDLGKVSGGWGQQPSLQDPDAGGCPTCGTGGSF